MIILKNDDLRFDLTFADYDFHQGYSELRNDPDGLVGSSLSLDGREAGTLRTTSFYRGD